MSAHTIMVYDHHLRFLLTAVHPGSAIEWQRRLFLCDLSRLQGHARWPVWLCATDGHRWHAVNVDVSGLPQGSGMWNLGVEVAELLSQRSLPRGRLVDVALTAGPSCPPGCEQVVPHCTRKTLDLEIDEEAIQLLAGEGSSRKDPPGGRRSFVFSAAPLGVGIDQPGFGTAWFRPESPRFRELVRNGRPRGMDPAKGVPVGVDMRYVTDAAAMARPKIAGEWLTLRLAAELDPVLMERSREDGLPMTLAVLMPKRIRD